jgi:hypothetical protein
MPNLRQSALVAEALRQNEEAMNDPNTPESVKRVLSVQALTIKALDLLQSGTEEQLVYVLTQLA